MFARKIVADGVAVSVPGYTALQFPLTLLSELPVAPALSAR
ncbi:MAG: hypothetical protein PF443_08465 [Allgaiera sp.]|nr:hypothetical protein [Allgaiera sp.]